VKPAGLAERTCSTQTEERAQVHQAQLGRGIQDTGPAKLEFEKAGVEIDVIG